MEIENMKLHHHNIKSKQRLLSAYFPQNMNDQHSLVRCHQILTRTTDNMPDISISKPTCNPTLRKMINLLAQLWIPIAQIIQLVIMLLSMATENKGGEALELFASNFLPAFGLILVAHWVMNSWLVLRAVWRRKSMAPTSILDALPLPSYFTETLGACTTTGKQGLYRILVYQAVYVGYLNLLAGAAMPALDRAEVAVGYFWGFFAMLHQITEDVMSEDSRWSSLAKMRMRTLNNFIRTIPTLFAACSNVFIDSNYMMGEDQLVHRWYHAIRYMMGTQLGAFTLGVLFRALRCQGDALLTFVKRTVPASVILTADGAPAVWFTLYLILMVLVTTNVVFAWLGAGVATVVAFLELLFFFLFQIDVDSLD